MKTIKLIPALSLFIPAIAAAQPESPDTTTGFDHKVPAVQNAFEIGVATGYAQGAGKLGGNMGSLEDVSGPGGAGSSSGGSWAMSRAAPEPGRVRHVLQVPAR